MTAAGGKVKLKSRGLRLQRGGREEHGVLVRPVLRLHGKPAGDLRRGQVPPARPGKLELGRLACREIYTVGVGNRQLIGGTYTIK